MSNFILNIKRAETPFYSFLKRLIKSILRFHLPCIKIIHLPLYHLDYLIKTIVRRLIHSFWSVPVFMARCTKVGKGLSLPNGIPWIIGSHLKIFLGDNVTIYSSVIGASKIFDEAVIKVGNNSSIGYGTFISVAKQVTIGDNCMIGMSCMIMDSDDHPVDPKKRLEGRPVDPEDVKPVKIGNNVWIGSYSVILKGVKIGDNSVIGTHSVITKDVMPNCVYAGYAARLIRRDIQKKFD
jgi:acetyltransferase-like isoleucine patch superfamily enzyme